MSPFPRLLIGYNIFAKAPQKCVIISEYFCQSFSRMLVCYNIFGEVFKNAIA